MAEIQKTGNRGLRYGIGMWMTQKKKIFKKFHPLLKRIYAYYLSKPRRYSFQDINIIVNPGVFHPGFFYSTKIFLQFLETIYVKDKRVLELGCGTGLISICLAKRKAKVTASDINHTALENTKINADKNDVSITLIESDLFDNLDIQLFDIIIINPPYYPAEPKNLSERAWYCGDDFDYFHKLFQQMSKPDIKNTDVYMILSEDCKIDHIEKIASTNNFSFTKVFEHVSRGEENYIFKIGK